MENSFQGDHNLRKVMYGELLNFKEIISKIHVQDLIFRGLKLKTDADFNSVTQLE